MPQSATARPNPAPGFAKRPDHTIDLKPCPKRIRTYLGDTCVADTTRALVMQEGPYPPVYYLPRDDVRMNLLAPTDHHTYCPFKGEARYWTVDTGGKTAENAVWGYDTPYDEMAALKDYVAFYWDRMDRWYEDDNEVSTPSA